MTMADGFVSVSRRIEVPAERLFALLTDSANHPLIDGSGMVREPASAVRVSGTGDAFVMDMHHDEFGDYQMRNDVVEYQAGRRLVWEPVRVESSSPDQQEVLGESARYRWGFELSPDGPGATMVTETFDCTRSPEELRKAVKEGEGWRDAMTASLARLELLAKAVDPA
ncbi:MAG: SRPBCC family protein [Streptosporangiaceae bacterium]